MKSLYDKINKRTDLHSNLYHQVWLSWLFLHPTAMQSNKIQLDFKDNSFHESKMPKFSFSTYVLMYMAQIVTSFNDRALIFFFKHQKNSFLQNFIIEIQLPTHWQNNPTRTETNKDDYVSLPFVLKIMQKSD